jgi:glyoxylase-like metal-dependent hydrolase (beta-lactamase superfamily II)
MATDYDPAGRLSTDFSGTVSLPDSQAVLFSKVFSEHLYWRYNYLRRSRRVERLERTRGGVMYFKQFYLGCLAHASYLIGSDGAAAVVDPQRDVDHYIQEANSQGLKIHYVIETHLHADFVSGHVELAARTGAQIVFGSKAALEFPHRSVRDGDEIRLGQVVLRFLETPGHTPESISVLVIDNERSTEPRKLLTGDVLFIGDVGRPDLAGSKGFTPQEMAGMLYDTLHDKVLTLDDAVEVYPAHGAGSMCGRNISSETHSTIGEQRRFNYALKPMPKEEFISLMTTDLPEVPAYFPRDAEINRAGAPALDSLKRPPALSPDEVDKSRDRALILDVRSPAAFGAGHINGSVNIGLGGKFASWAGSLIPVGMPIVIVAEDGHGVDEAVMRLARVGIDTVTGYLEGGIYGWDKAGLPLATIPQMPVDELQHRIAEPERFQLIDVRGPGEYNSGHAPGAITAPLARIEEHAGSIRKDLPIIVICASGYRSSIASSLLEKRGFTNIFNVIGGTSAWISAGYNAVREAQGS